MDDKKIEIFQTSDGQTDIRVQFEEDSVWLNRQQLSELFDRDVKTLGKHINNVFKEGELDKHSVVAKFATTETAKLGVKTIPKYNNDTTFYDNPSVVLEEETP
jgi:hypothetical protein